MYLWRSVCIKDVVRGSGQTECGEGSFCRARFCHRSRCGVKDERHKETPIGFGSFNFCAASFAALCALTFSCCWSSEISRAQAPDPEKAVYARAVEFCRGTVKRPMALDLDKRVLCFDGPILPGTDVSLARTLEPNGLFVVRSRGGDSDTAVALADLLRDRHATVVVYDYCISACADYLFMASTNTFVVRDTIVAWHHPVDPLWCPSLVVPKDGGPKRLETSACSDAPPEYQRGYREFKDRNDTFYAERGVDPPFEVPPESFTIRKILRNMFEGTGRNPNVGWTWNPRYYASTLKMKIIYEAYPNSQAEVDAMMSKFGLGGRILYDP